MSTSQTTDMSLFTKSEKKSSTMIQNVRKVKYLLRPLEWLNTLGSMNTHSFHTADDTYSPSYQIPCFHQVLIFRTMIATIYHYTPP